MTTVDLHSDDLIWYDIYSNNLDSLKRHLHEKQAACILFGKALNDFHPSPIACISGIAAEAVRPSDRFIQRIKQPYENTLLGLACAWLIQKTPYISIKYISSDTLKICIAATFTIGYALNKTKSLEYQQIINNAHKIVKKGMSYYDYAKAYENTAAADLIERYSSLTQKENIASNNVDELKSMIASLNKKLLTMHSSEAGSLSAENQRLHDELAQSKQEHESTLRQKNDLIASLRRQIEELVSTSENNPTNTASGNWASFQSAESRRRQPANQNNLASPIETSNSNIRPSQ